MELSDQPALLKLKNESWWGTHGTLIANPQDQLRWFESISSDQLYMIAENNSGRIGIAVYTNIDHLNRSLNISGSIFKSQRTDSNCKAAFAAGLDFAFEVLNMRRVQAEVLESNYPAQILELDFLEFEVEGVRRKAVYKSGRYYDSLVLGMLREEWQNCPRVKSYGDTCNLNFSHDVAERMSERAKRRRMEVCRIREKPHTHRE